MKRIIMLLATAVVLCAVLVSGCSIPNLDLSPTLPTPTIQTLAHTTTAPSSQPSALISTKPSTQLSIQPSSTTRSSSQTSPSPSTKQSTQPSAKPSTETPTIDSLTRISVKTDPPGATVWVGAKKGWEESINYKAGRELGTTPVTGLLYPYDVIWNGPGYIGYINVYMEKEGYKSNIHTLEIGESGQLLKGHTYEISDKLYPSNST